MANAQTTKVTGTVISAEDNEPIIGASIVVKGTTIGTVTDFNGAFSLDVPSSAKTLVVSFVGMKAQEIGVKPKVNVVLEGDNQMLDEVMIVAYGTAKKSAFTGSAATIKSEKITSRQTSNVTNALSGQVAGVQTTSNSGQPGKDAEVRIRGIGSISASNKPLYVVDGVPYDGEISAISTSDIESMTVLKDAASNALYGARGANGVILITTKKGKAGVQRITYSSGLTVDHAISLPEFQNSYGAKAGSSWGEKENVKDYDNAGNWLDRKSTRLNSSHVRTSRMPSSA